MKLLMPKQNNNSMFMRIIKLGLCVVFGFMAQTIQAQFLNLSSNRVGSEYTYVEVQDTPPETEKRISLVSFLREVEEYYKVRFIYENKVIDNKEVSAGWERKNSLESNLKRYLYPNGLMFRWVDKRQIIIYPEAIKLKQRLDGVDQLAVNQQAFSSRDELRISRFLDVIGIVTDSTGKPLHGVSIVVKNKQGVGTTTDENGRFVLEVEDNATLVFSMVGYFETEVALSGRRKIEVRMIPVTGMLDETVVVAFGTKQKKEDVVGSVTTVDPQELKIPASNLTNALAGRAAGLISYQQSGEPGNDNAQFFIRGVTTFGYKVDPLILVDNDEVSATSLARMQVDDIESFSILKDATATAVYGARGANGVILITTKQGKQGKAKLSLRVENSTSTPTQNVKLADPVTYMKLANEAVLGRDPKAMLQYSPVKIENTINGLDPLRYPAIDWRNELLKDYTMNQRINLNVSGGGSVARYFISGALNQDNGVLKVPRRNNFNNNINLKSYSIRSNVDIKLSQSTDLAVRLYGSFDDYNGPIDGGVQVFRDIMRTPPSLFAPYYPAGEKYSYRKHIMFGNYGGGTYLNPYADMVKGYRQYARSKMQAQVELNQKLSMITPGLSFILRSTAWRYSYFSLSREYTPFYYQLLDEESQNDDEYNYSLLNDGVGTEYLGYSEGSKDIQSVFSLQTILNYHKAIGDNDFNGMLVSMLRSELNGNAGSLQASLPHRNMGFAGRFTYSFKKRYYLEFNFGYNGSERFSKSHRYGFFPSAGVVWHASKEKFLDWMNPVISNLRIRATYGMAGNDAIGSPTQRFFYLSQVNMNSTDRAWIFGVNRDENKNGISVTRYANEDITWEVAYKANLGFEFSLFRKLQVELDLFNQVRKKIFMQRSDIPTTMGLSADVFANIGEASGSGLDLSMKYSKSINKDWWVTGMVNFTYATSKYKVFEEPEYEYPWLYNVGYPLSVLRGYIAERLFIDKKEVLNSPEQQLGGDVRGGDIKYVDVNGDGRITSLDRVPLGYPTIPEINYGFGVSVGYKSFDFSIFMEGIARKSFFIDPSAIAPFRRYVYSGESSDKFYQNQVLEAFASDHWSEDNRNIYALYPRLSWIDGNPNNEVRSTWWMRNGAFLRVKQVEVGHTFKKNAGLLKRLKMNDFRVYINGTNLLTFSKFNLWDIEMGSNGFNYPLQKVYNIGLRLGF